MCVCSGAYCCVCSCLAPSWGRENTAVFPCAVLQFVALWGSVKEHRVAVSVCKEQASKPIIPVEGSLSMYQTQIVIFSQHFLPERAGELWLLIHLFSIYDSCRDVGYKTHFKHMLLCSLRLSVWERPVQLNVPLKVQPSLKKYPNIIQLNRYPLHL